MSQQEPSQSQSIGNNSAFSGQMGLAGGNLYQIGNNSEPLPEKQLTVVEVIKCFEEIETLLRNSSIQESEKQEAIGYLEKAKGETQKEPPKKEKVAMNLQLMAQTIKDASGTVEATKSLLEKIQPIITKLISWFGVAKNLLGF